MQDKNVLFLVHRIFKDNIVKRGGADYITDFLISKGYSIITIEHPLDGPHKTYIKTDKDTKAFSLIGKGPIRWIQEIIFNFINAPRTNVELIISVDPLNFLSAYLIKLINRRKAKILFHSIDYSESRFGNTLLDSVYNSLYSFAVRNADVVTYVSEIMGGKIKEIIKLNAKTKNILFHLPNSPEFTKIPKVDISQKNKYSIVYSKSFISKEELILLQNVIMRLKKDYPKIILHIVGNIDGINGTTKTDLKRNLVIYGLIPYEKNIEIISNAYIGIGWYENKFSFEKYNDSLKLREYAASGIPAVCNDKTSTAIEMEKEGAGIVTNTVAEIASAISALLSDEKKYSEMHNNAIQWAKKNDKSKLLEQLLDKLNLC